MCILWIWNLVGYFQRLFFFQGVLQRFQCGTVCQTLLNSATSISMLCIFSFYMFTVKWWALSWVGLVWQITRNYITVWYLKAQPHTPKSCMRREVSARCTVKGTFPSGRQSVWGALVCSMQLTKQQKHSMFIAVLHLRGKWSCNHITSGKQMATQSHVAEFMWNNTLAGLCFQVSTEAKLYNS